MSVTAIWSFNCVLIHFQDKLPDTHLDPPAVKRMIPLPVIGIDDTDAMLKDNEGSIIVSCFHLLCCR